MSAEAENILVKKRGRKKLLYQSILKQMEFYFSSANLNKDRWLSKKLLDEDSICLTEFLNFNKIKSLTDNVNDLAKALRKSEILIVSEDMRVKRSKPIKIKENEDDYVIYVEQIPPDTDHDWIRSIFSVYGEIDYISIPKAKSTHKSKGFAFVEFAEIESAKRAVEDFRERGNYLPTDTAPQELLSIVKYEANDGFQQDDKEGFEKDMVLPCQTEAPVSEPSTSKKRKTSELLENDQESKKLKTDDLVKEQSEEILKENNGVAGPEKTTEEVKKKKNKKKKNKKNSESNENCGLQILTKKDWKALRNKYLNMQREKMKQLKKYLSMANKKSDQTTFNNKKKNTDVEAENAEAEKITNENVERIPFSPGLIVKIKFDEPVVFVKDLKNELKKDVSIKYVDVKEGESKVYLRFETKESAQHFCENSSYPKTKVLSGEKESNYWEKLQQQRQTKLTIKIKKKERGKDKLIKKAENILGKHIIFEDK